MCQNKRCLKLNIFLSSATLLLQNSVNASIIGLRLAKAQQKSQIEFFTFASGSKPQSTMSACLAIVFSINNLFGMGPDCQPQNGWV